MFVPKNVSRFNILVSQKDKFLFFNVKNIQG
jgi:hypothetical protein